MTVAKLSPDGTDLAISWDTTTCDGADQHNLIFGFGSGLPATPGGGYAPAGGVCTIGDTSPYVWNASVKPSTATDGLWK